MICTVCGGEDFEKHAGFMYCSVCQTQSQEYHEQEYDYQAHDKNVVRKQKSQTSIKKSSNNTIYDDGLWTTWEGFNYILHGMTQEMKKCGVNKEFESIVFKLWAAYLKECQVAFTSNSQEKIPKLGLWFRPRDARILYNIDASKDPFRERRTRSKVSNTSVSSVSACSKRSLALQRGKIIAAEYQDHLSLSVQNNSNVVDSLELLGASELETTDQSSDSGETYVKNFKEMLTRKSYKLLKDSNNSKQLLKNAKEKAKRDVQTVGKNKLLSIIHLALLITGSQIQLSDLLRFIRESHLSYAKVTHFFPSSFKLPKKDFSYIEVISDAYMPTHLHQRKITNQLARLIKIEKILTPDTCLLIDRYCHDLNLPKQVAEFSKRILVDNIPAATVPKSKTLLPSFEAWAMVSIIFVMKLLLGLNDKTEIFLSHLAREMNSAKSSCNRFVFEDWQKFIECRKVVLTEFHYPTQEQLSKSSFQSSKYFLNTLTNESKDEYRKSRFIPYSKYYIEENFLSGIKQMLNVLAKPQNVESFEFEPSLTPQTCHLKTIMRNLTKELNYTDDEAGRQKSSNAFPQEILNQSFENCDLEFAFDPKSNLDSLKKKPEFGCSSNESPEKNHENLLYDCSSNYWTFKYPDTVSGHLENFKEEILKKTPENFQWLIKECARMLEMNVRDVYDELLNLEQKLSLSSMANLQGVREGRTTQK